MRILSLGVGVQSSTLALMAERGDIAPVDCAIMADTGAEPTKVYEYLDYLRGLVRFPIHVVSRGNLRTDLIASITDGKRCASIPFFTESGGEIGMAMRQCTSDYKIAPIRRKIREIHGGKPPKEPVRLLIGISMDEVIRMKPSVVKYIINEFPLIDKGMTRRDCLRYLEDRQYRLPPKSACTFCPFRSDEAWAHMRAMDPGSFADAVAVDAALRTGTSKGKMRGTLYIHRSGKPLGDIPLAPEDWGQGDLFGNECEGMCGV